VATDRSPRSEFRVLTRRREGYSDAVMLDAAMRADSRHRAGETLAGEFPSFGTIR
jgi:hypothetical protein